MPQNSKPTYCKQDEDTRLILDNTSSLVSILDKKATYLYANPAHKDTLGYPPEELQGRPGFDLVHPDDRGKLAETLRKGISGEINRDVIQYRAVDKDGHIHYMEATFDGVRDEQGRLERIICVTDDISEKRQLESALREKNEQVRMILDTVPVAMAEVDVQGKYRLINRTYSEIFEYTEADLSTMTVMDLAVNPEEGRQLLSLLKELAADQPPPFPWEGRNRTRSGRIREVVVHWDYTKDRQGKITGFITAISDVTEQKQITMALHEKTAALETALKELRRTQRHFTEQERHRALSRMASGIAHDFNNSLSTILGFSDLLLQAPDKLTDIQSVHRYLSLINTAAHDAAQIVRRLRKFYRPSDDERIEPLDLNTLVKESLDLTEPAWKHDARARGAPIHVETKFGASAPITGNRAELHETITNLIFNAVDAMPGGGQMRFCTRQAGPWIVLEIGDTGIGMDENVRRQCLDPFFTTKGEAGSGLGLATALGIITRHQGELDIHSQPGRGTTFLLRLPAGIAAEPTGRPEKSTAPSRSSLKILVIDDEKTQLELLRAFLRQENHQVDTAANGLEGMQKFHRGWYDLIITDRAMPELNGDALARNIKRITPGKPIIMLTGFGDMMAAAGETPEAADMVITKPVSLEKLRQAIETLLTG